MGVFFAYKHPLLHAKRPFVLDRLLANRVQQRMFVLRQADMFSELLSKMLGGEWILLYSKQSQEQGKYPYHIEPMDTYQRRGAGSMDWRQVFKGTQLECTEKLESILERNPVYINEYEPKPKKREATKEQRMTERAKMTPTLRYSILKRDRFRCKSCGRTESDGVVLHIDHILAVSNGGKTESDNLQTLCDICNHGKGVR